MKREDLLAKGFTEEQVTEILNMHHNESLQVNKENERLKGELASANEKVASYSNMEQEYNAFKQSQMTEQEKTQQEKIFAMLLAEAYEKDLFNKIQEFVNDIAEVISKAIYDLREQGYTDAEIIQMIRSEEEN